MSTTPLFPIIYSENKDLYESTLLGRYSEFFQLLNKFFLQFVCLLLLTTFFFFFFFFFFLFYYIDLSYCV